MAVKTWALAARPKTLIASLSPILIGTTVAWKDGSLSPWVFLFTLLTGLGIQVSTNFINDLYDFLKGADTSARKGPVRVTQSGLMSVAEVKKATLCLVGLTALCGSLLIARGGLVIALLLPLALLFAYAYTAGPYPLAYLGLAEIFVLIFFGPVAAGCTYYLQTLTWSLLPFLFGLSPGLISCSLLVVNNLRDVTEDIDAKKKTLVARFGIRFGKIEYGLALFLACFLPFLFAPKPPLLLPLLICIAPAYSLALAVARNDDPFAYNPLLGKTGKFLSLYTFIFCLAYIL